MPTAAVSAYLLRLHHALKVYGLHFPRRFKLYLGLLKLWLAEGYYMGIWGAEFLHGAGESSRGLVWKLSTQGFSWSCSGRGRLIDVPFPIVLMISSISGCLVTPVAYSAKEAFLSLRDRATHSPNLSALFMLPFNDKLCLS